VPAPTAAPADLLVCAACHALEALRHRSASGRITSPAEHQTPWAELLGFRLNAPREFDFEFKDDHAGYRVLMRAVGNGWECRIGDETLLVEGYRIDGNGLHIDFATRAVTGTVIGCGDETHVFADGRHVRLRQIDRLHNTGDDVETANNLVAPMPGAVTSVLVDVGVKVTRGTPLLILEAMKIEHTISAPYDGTVREIHFRAGDQVTAEGIELISLEPLETASA
jgi:3-methylcrotonyl-CoA carboxylase alpha subunit